jgi:hypothetical protein
MNIKRRTQKMNKILHIAREETEQKGWKIDNDDKAEWALTRIQEEENESKRFVDDCQKRIDIYQKKIEKEQERLNYSTGILKAQLLEYFATVPHKKTKTQETYRLPSGNLKLKYGKLQYRHDDKALLKFLQDRDMTDYIKTTQAPKWGDIRKTLVPAGDKAVNQDGEIVEGVTVEHGPEEFKVEI